MMSKNSPDGGGGFYAIFVTWTKSHAPRSQGKVKYFQLQSLIVTNPDGQRGLEVEGSNVSN